MKGRHVIQMIAVVVLLAGSVAMAGESVDVNPGSDARSATLRADTNTGPDGVVIDTRNDDGPRLILPPPMREKKGQSFREMRRKPDPIGGSPEVCSDDQLSGLLAQLFGYANVMPSCGGANRD